ncbi:MAG TPA: VOC family protein [Rhizomicrobium sp.]|nr:VOC family protein [Rhizomicrobium sp.]
MNAPFRYRRLGYVAINVTDMARSCDFLENVMGLDRAGTSEAGESFFRCTLNHHDVMLCEAAEPGFKRVGWQLEDEENLDNAFEHFTRIGLNPVMVDKAETDRIGLGRAFRLREPTTGAEFEYFAKIRQTIKPFQKRLADIQRPGHVVLSTPNLKESVEFATREMNFRVSDYVGEWVALMRCWPNPFHHSFALGQSRSGKPGHHHVNFMVTSVDDVGRLFWRAQKTNTKIVFGPGRHPPSDSVCLYVLDPDKLMWEYSYGMEEFPEIGAREPRLMSTQPEDMDFWGAVPQPEFVNPTGAVEQAAA